MLPKSRIKVDAVMRDEVKDYGKVLANWEEIKKQEKIIKEDDSSFLTGAFDEAEDLIGRARRRKGL